MAAKHIYLMSLAASGKSTFANAHPEYAGYRVVDFAQELPKRNPFVVVLMYILRPFPALQTRVRRNPRMNKIGPHYYFDTVAEYLDKLDRPHVVMGRRLPPKYLQHESFLATSIGIVMIPEEQHRRNCESRRAQLRNPLPFFHHWTTDFSHVKTLRQRMQEYARDNGIPIFESFPAAVDGLKTAAG